MNGSFRITCGVNGHKGPDHKWVFPHAEVESAGIVAGLILEIPRLTNGFSRI
jgi:hypothetical protein